MLDLNSFKTCSRISLHWLSSRASCIMQMYKTNLVPTAYPRCKEHAEINGLTVVTTCLYHDMSTTLETGFPTVHPASEVFETHYY